MEAPEIHNLHARHGGGLPRWLELVVVVSALVTSVSSIVIAVHNGRVMERLVEANSIPYMQGGFSDVTPEGKDVLSLDLLNRGVGPAHEESLRVKVGNGYVKLLSGPDFRLRSGLSRLSTLMKYSTRSGTGCQTRFIPGGQSQFVFRIAKTAENSKYWDLLQKDAFVRWDVEYLLLLGLSRVLASAWRLARTRARQAMPARRIARIHPLMRLVAWPLLASAGCQPGEHPRLCAGWLKRRSKPAS